jgi:hypothetical protein
VPRRTSGDNSGAELRAWLIDQERELLTDTVTPIPWHRGKEIPAAEHVGPPDLDAISEDDPLAWELSGDLRTLVRGRAYRLDRRDLPLDHPARRAGELGDALVLTERNELIEDR